MEITQADRRSSSQVFELLDAEKLTVKAVQGLFAAHRLAERAKVVAWLPKQPPHLALQEYADAIEAGEHVNP